MWECKKCGACCKFPPNQFLAPDLWDEEKQQCKFLNDDNTCSIYAYRPDICRVNFLILPNGKKPSEKLLNMGCEYCRQYIKEVKKED